MEMATRSAGAGEGSDNASPLLEVRGLRKSFVRRRSIREVATGAPRERIHAVDGVSFSVRAGEVLGLAGESGSGKSVTGELLAALQTPDSGEVLFEGLDLSQHTKTQRRRFRRDVSMVFQDPYDALNPRSRVLDSVTEPLRIHRIGTAADQRSTGLEALDKVGLRPADHYAVEYPHQLSGGERQRAAVARALVTEPKLLIADEPTTMLDVSVRTGLLNLLRRITDEEGLAMVFVSHDFTTLEYLCDRIVIMYLGRIAENGTASDVLQRSFHPYTKVLASAIPLNDPDGGRPRVKHSIDVGSPDRTGCLFVPRCPHVMEICGREVPPLREPAIGHHVSCRLFDEEWDDRHVPLVGADSPRSQPQLGATGGPFGAGAEADLRDEAKEGEQ